MSPQLVPEITNPSKTSINPNWVTLKSHQNQRAFTETNQGSNQVWEEDARFGGGFSMRTSLGIGEKMGL